MGKNCFIIAFVLLCTSCANRDERLVGVDVDGRVKVGVTKLNEAATAGAEAEYVGTIEAETSVDIGFQVAGRLLSLPIKEGQHVVKGQVIATIDNTAAMSSYRAAKATLDRAEDAMRRARQVYVKGSLPEVKWIEVQTQVNQAQSVYDIAEKNLSDCTLRSPISGTVAKCHVQAGATVSPLQPVARVMNLNSIRVGISVPEGDIAGIRIGDTVSVSVNAADSIPITGIVDAKDVSSDPISHSYIVHAKLQANSEQMTRLLPGMVCRVKMVSRRKDDKTGKREKESNGTDNAGTTQFLVPQRSVQVDPEGGRFVWVVAADSTAVRTPVVIGDLTNRGVIVTQGLAQGDIIVTDGTHKIASGTKVKF